ncbi:MAG: type II toxin-antitoxin system PemK/MazF family toxin [bacterium]
MTIYNSGEVILLLFPFVDTKEMKRRPALVLLDTKDEDIIVARITSQITQTAFDVLLIDWQKAGLLLPSIVRMHKIATIEKRFIERKLGNLTHNDWLQVQSKIKQLWSLIL